MAELSRHQLRAARALLALRQEALADLAGVGVATIRRFEGGRGIERGNLAALRAAIEAEGAILVGAGTVVGGRTVAMGVLLPPEAELPARTRRRLAASDGSVERSEGVPPPEQSDGGVRPGD